VKTEAEIKAMLLQANKDQARNKTPGTRGAAWTRPFPTALGRHQPADVFPELLSSRTMRY